MPEQHSPRILIVDDAASSRQLVKAQLRAFDYELFEAADGMEALEHLHQDHPDVVLMDIHMPKMDGYQATRIIKKNSAKNYVSVIFVTAQEDEEAIAQCAEAGGDDFLIKPLTPTILDARIRAALQRRQLYRTLQVQHQELEKHRFQEEREQEIARDIFARIVHLGCLDEVGIKYLVSSLMVFNGDMLLAERTPYGALRVMLGDFTGHGLTAAIGLYRPPRSSMG